MGNEKPDRANPGPVDSGFAPVVAEGKEAENAAIIQCKILIAGMELEGGV